MGGSFTDFRGITTLDLPSSLLPWFSISWERDSERPVGLGREVISWIILHKNVLSASRLLHAESCNI